MAEVEDPLDDEAEDIIQAILVAITKLPSLQNLKKLTIRHDQWLSAVGKDEYILEWKKQGIETISFVTELIDEIWILSKMSQLEEIQRDEVDQIMMQMIMVMVTVQRAFGL